MNKNRAPTSDWMRARVKRRARPSRHIAARSAAKSPWTCFPARGVRSRAEATLRASTQLFASRIRGAHTRRAAGVRVVARIARAGRSTARPTR
eukprot:6747937-Lingulodinium_polyedra.AAC.2